MVGILGGLRGRGLALGVVRLGLLSARASARPGVGRWVVVAVAAREPLKRSASPPRSSVMGRPARGMADGVLHVRLCVYIGMLCVYSIEVLKLAVIGAVVHSSDGVVAP